MLKSASDVSRVWRSAVAFLAPPAVPSGQPAWLAVIVELDIYAGAVGSFVSGQVLLGLGFACLSLLPICLRVNDWRYRERSSGSPSERAEARRRARARTARTASQDDREDLP